jgi:hypothetical protein
MELQKMVSNNLPNNKKAKKGEEESDPVEKKMKELQTRMNDLRRWHNSKQHILEIKIKENLKTVQELEIRKRELES